MNIMQYYSYYSEQLNSYMTTYFIIGVIVSVIMGCIWGAVTAAINEHKGYDGGFAWGFFLGLIGVIVVASRAPYVRPQPVYKPMTITSGWVCTCGRTHDNYVSSCVCGNTKRDALQGKKTEQNPESSKINTLKEYKKLLDEGIITQEEFDQKKTEILSKK